MRLLYKTNFKVGDIVTIRGWDDMELEFGVDDQHNYIQTSIAFLPTMRNYCGKKARIISILDSDDILPEYRLKTINLGGADFYSFSEEMFVETYAEPNYDLRDKLIPGEFNETLI